ncbi:MAG TPA: GNAT family protein [Bacteroidota bacterium]|nr:GNAT family protein [Bacteroidota bacterium]
MTRKLRDTSDLPGIGPPEDAHSFLRQSDTEWARWPAGPYLIRARTDHVLVGGTGLTFETPYRAMTGYVLAKDAWGMGYATETLRAIVELARELGVRRLYALCHTQHAASRHVLEKGAFQREGTLRQYMEFPNLSPGQLFDVFCYARILERGRPATPAES